MAQIGFMPLLAIGFLVGSWLLFPSMQDDNEIFDPGAEEMPRANQALRGATLNTMFGTNRVSSNITWTANWNALRHETSSSGGGGKGGGSGGSKMPEAPGQVSYTYTWDVMCTLGMVPERYSLYGGWMNQQRMNDDTIASIAQDFAIFSFTATAVPQDATLQFTDAFYSGGAKTGGFVGDNWTYWETQEGFPCRWPHVVWIGFETLNLGNKAALPVLEWEVGPGDADFTFDSAYVDQVASNTTAAAKAPNIHQFLVGDDGNFYTVAIEDTNTAHIDQFDVAAGTYNQTDTLTGADFDADMKANGAPSSTRSYNVTWTVSMIQNSDKYFCVWGWGENVVLRASIGFGLYKINSSGNAEMAGFFMTRSNQVLGALRPGEIEAVAISNEGTDVDPVITCIVDSVSATFTPRILVFPSVNQMLFVANGGTGPFIDDTQAGADDYDASSQSLHTLTVDGVDIALNFANHTSDRFQGSWNYGWFMPKAVVSALGVEWQTTLNFYINKADIQWHDDNPASSSGNQYIYDTSSTYPNGHAFKLTYGVIPAYTNAPLVPTTSIINSKFVGSDQVAIMPFDDEGKDKDGNVETGSGYNPFPTIQKIVAGQATGMFVAMWGKLFASNASNSTTGEYIKVRGFLYNPIDETYEEFDTGEGATLDTVSDLGQTEDDRHLGTYWHVMPVWDQTNEILYKVGLFHGGFAFPPGDVHIAKAGNMVVAGVGDVLPPYIINEILTNEVFGMGLSASDVNQSSLTDALTYCRSEDIFVSVQYTREASKLQVIEELLSLYGGFLTISGGKVKFHVQDATATSQRVLDNDHLIRDGDKPPVEITVSAKDDSFNKVLVNYIDRSLEYRQNQVEINDEVDQDLTGVRKKEFPAKFVMSKQTATNLGLRALWSNLYGKDTYGWAVGIKDSDLEAGDVITLVDSFHSQLEAGVDVRITRIAETRPGHIDMIGVTEIAYINTSSDGAIDVTSATARDPIYGPSRIPANQWAYELPREFYGTTPKVYIGYNALSPNRGAWLYASDDGVSYAQVSAAEPFVISGILADALPTRPDGYLEQGVEVFLFPDTRSGFTASSPVYVNTFALETTGASGRQGGLNTLIINSEAMAFQGATLLGQNHYRFDRLYRGWGGTHIQDHSSGAFWHRHGGGIFGIEYNEDKVGIAISYKVVPYNFAGQGVDVSSVQASSYVIQGSFFRPQMQGTVKWSINSVANGQNSVDLRGAEFVQVFRDPSDFNLLLESTSIMLTEAGDEILLDNGVNVNLSFAWSDSARLAGWGTQGYGTGGYGRFTQDTSSTQYRVEVLSNDLSTVVRCVSVNTGSWTYSADTIRNDFGDWKGDFLIKVTPYNDFGDAPRTATKRTRAF